MFNSLSGIISGKDGDSLKLDTGGIEWEISVPANDLALFPRLGEKSRVFVWLYHREDQMRLFGFIDERRRATFLELIKIEGIGPRQAVKIMGGLSQEAFEQALEAADTTRLEAVPGLGKKTAQKMILAMKGRLVSAEKEQAESAEHKDLLDALSDMGFDRKTAALALEKLSKTSKDKLSENELFKQAIMVLSSR